jgi:hypothetical protein
VITPENPNIYANAVAHHITMWLKVVKGTAEMTAAYKPRP